MKGVFALLMLIASSAAMAQTGRISVIGSSTAAGVGASSSDSSWVGRLNTYYKYQLGIVDSIHRLGVSGTTPYHGMPTSYVPPGGRPSPDPLHNVTRAVSLLQGLAVPANGVVIVNYPSNGYDTYTIAEIMSRLQTIYDSAVLAGNRCYVTTTQPRSDGNFSQPSVRLKMAVLKDSIINRFGVANTLNFWDGMYDPADTTILAIYRADSTHFNNLGHRILFDRVVAKNIFNLPAPAVGDYRSNVSPTGLWNTAASWQTWDGTAWVTAVAAPASANGVITISSGDSIRVNTATTVDQVVVEGGAVLAFFNTGTPTTFTLNDAAGDDIVNNGRLYVSAGATLTGTGTIRNNGVGSFILRNQGILQVNATNYGNMTVSGTGNIQNATLTNNKTCVLVDFTLNLNSASFINNDSFCVLYTGSSFIAGTGGAFTNAVSGVFFKPAGTGIMRVNTGVTFTNNGRLKGFGEYQFINVPVNNGQIAPGNSPGQITVNPAFITGKSPVVNLEITTGGVPVTNYDQLIFSVVDFLNTNVTGTTLNVTDLSTDAVGTSYILAASPSGTITGPFAAVNLPATLGNLVYSSNTVAVQKVTPLPLTWGIFTVQAGEQEAMLHWSTLQERNTARFSIEHGTDGRAFQSIGTVPAKGFSTTRNNYTFTHRSPDPGKVNYYRIRLEDNDGQSSYSAVRPAWFGPDEGEPVRVAPNPVKEMMQVVVLRENMSMIISDLQGRQIRQYRLVPGVHTISLADLPAATYQLTILEKERRIGTRQLLKL